MVLTHSPFFAALMMLFLTLLGMNTSRVRMKLGIYRGDGDNAEMHFAQRAHGNAAEHLIPMAILLLVLEMVGGPKQAIVVLGSLCLLVRFAKAAAMIARVASLSVGTAALTYTLEVVMAGWAARLGLRMLGSGT